MIEVITENCTPSTIKWSVKQLVNFASQYNSVLDVGCGDGKIIKMVRSKKRIGIDACSRALHVARKNNNGVLFQQLNLENTMRQDEKRVVLPKVECVIGVDIIEHFFQRRAFELIEVCEHTATKCVMFFIPVGHHPQSRDDRGFGNHYFQTHRSKWFPEYMDYLGYDVWFYPNWHKRIHPSKQKGAMWCRKILG